MNLELLFVSANRLADATNVAPIIAEMPRLRRIELSGNKLTRIPFTSTTLWPDPRVGRAGLEYVALEDNIIASFPAAWTVIEAQNITTMADGPVIDFSTRGPFDWDPSNDRENRAGADPYV